MEELTNHYWKLALNHERYIWKRLNQSLFPHDLMEDAKQNALIKTYESMQKGYLERGSVFQIINFILHRTIGKTIGASYGPVDVPIHYWNHRSVIMRHYKKNGFEAAYKFITEDLGRTTLSRPNVNTIIGLFCFHDRRDVPNEWFFEQIGYTADEWDLDPYLMLDWDYNEIGGDKTLISNMIREIYNIDEMLWEDDLGSFVKKIREVYMIAEHFGLQELVRDTYTPLFKESGMELSEDHTIRNVSVISMESLGFGREYGRQILESALERLSHY